MYLSKSLIIGLTNNQTFDKPLKPYYNKSVSNIIDMESMIVKIDHKAYSFYY